jgi:hypothetical protein
VFKKRSLIPDTEPEEEPTDVENRGESGDLVDVNVHQRNTTQTVGPTSSAFVSFTSLKAAQTAKQILQTSNSTEINVSPAPVPTDIVWENIGLSRNKEITRRFISWTLTVILILFWTVLTTFVASLASVERLQKIKHLPYIFAAHPFLKTFAKELPTILLLLMTSIAPSIFRFLSKKERHASLSQVNESNFSKLLYFQTFQNFFVLVVAGTYLESLYEILNKPQRIISLLGSTMPGQSTIFMCYLIGQVSQASQCLSLSSQFGN